MNLFHQYLFLIPVIVMVLSELTKAGVGYLKTGSWHAGLFRTGGMPSTHSAFVTSLLMVVERKLGAHSVEFAITFVFAAVVWFDAISLRREVGLQAAMLNTLQHTKHFREQVGHNLKEIIAGITFGAVVTQIGIWIS